MSQEMGGALLRRPSRESAKFIQIRIGNHSWTSMNPEKQGIVIADQIYPVVND
jgi:hypothetical protein